MKKITASDLQKQAEQLLHDAQMPRLEQVLATVAETREKYAAEIVEARKNASANRN